MRDLLILGGAFALSVCMIELLVKHKLQSALGTVAAVHGAGLAVALVVTRHVGVAGVLVFWTGLAACWFGVRSHVESSILLRLLHILRDGSSTREEILVRYQRDHSKSARIDELLRAGLVARAPDGVQVTPKGRAVARLVLLLR